MLHIRKALPTDAAAIAPLMLLAMEEITYFLIGQDSKAEALDFLTHFIELPANQYSYENCSVAEADGVILGHINCYAGAHLHMLREPIINYLSEHYQQKLFLENETEAGEDYIDTLAISPQAQGKGIGSKLINHLITKRDKLSPTKLGLLVDKENPSAEKLYVRLGFIKVQEKTLFNKTLVHLQLF